jgi:hypothetical protein
MKKLFIISLSVFMIMLPVVGSAADIYGADEADAAAADTLLVRPFGVVSLAIGTAVFIVSLPFAVLGGNVGETAKVLVADPFNYTFARPVGEFEREYED